MGERPRERSRRFFPLLYLANFAMSIDIKCNSCSSKYSVSDRFAGGSVKCSKCHAPIHVPIVPRQPPPAPAATAADAAELAFEYTPHYSPPSSSSAAVQTAPPPAAAATPAQTSAAVEEPAAEIPAAEASASDASAAGVARSPRMSFAWLKLPASRLDRLSAASSSADFRLRNYWTARLAPALWLVSLVAACSLIVAAVRQLFSLGGLPAELQTSALWGGVAQISVIAAALIAVRISLETVSVLFEIAGTLREVRDELRSRA